MTRPNKFLSLLLTGALLLSLAAPQAAAVQTYYGDVLVAMNPSLSDDTLTEGSFSPAVTEEETNALPSTVRSVYTDPDSGQELTILEVRRPPLVLSEAGFFNLPVRFSQAQTASYQEGDTFFFHPLNSFDKQIMACLYIGEHCTVWGNTLDAPAITLTVDIARDIGEHFDGYYEDVVKAFGQEYDADGDGKLAIMCYDIENEYPAPINAYTAGLFNTGDLVDRNSRINGINFIAPFINGIDCIHLDTYPGMGGLDAPLGDVSRSYSTLVHEFQHLINFSWQVMGGPASYVDPMEVYLNEAFSMAAEHMICGADACTSRITYFNGSDYIPGYPLSYWTNDIDTGLSNYANAYLFGQYLRTRYGTLTGTDGNTLFREILSARTPENEADTLALIADKLGTEPLQLVQDFWSAVYLKQDSGPLGFAGEAWADAIAPVISALDPSSTGGIGNGSARFYSLGSDGFTPGTSTNLTFLPLADQGCAATVSSKEDGTPVSAAIQTTENGYAIVAFYNTSGQMVDLCMAPIVPGTNIVDLSGLDKDISDCSWKIILTNENHTPLCSPITP